MTRTSPAPVPDRDKMAAQPSRGKRTGEMAMLAMPEDWDRAIVVAAHPDDIEYGIASAVARWTGQGKQVTYLLATRGEAGIARMRPHQVRPLRVGEGLRGGAPVGVTEGQFLGHRDGLVECGITPRRDP